MDMRVIASKREIKHHKLPEDANNGLEVRVLDQPAPDGAHHQYAVVLNGKTTGVFYVKFQRGPIKEAGVNGVTHEALLAILIDRMESFQSGRYATQENADALFHLREALGALHRRTMKRIKRGVEGTSAE